MDATNHFVVLKGTKTGVFQSRTEAERVATSREPKDFRAFSSLAAATEWYKTEMAKRKAQPQQQGIGLNVFQREKRDREEREKNLKRARGPVTAGGGGGGGDTVVGDRANVSLTRVPDNVVQAMQGKAVAAPTTKRRSFAPKTFHGNTKAQALTQAALESAKATVAALTPKLNAEQKRVADLVLAGKNVFFSGSAGTGKSLLLTYIVALLRQRGAEEGRGVAVTASTGVAAVNVQGTTLHRFACIGRGEGTPAELLRKVKNSPDQGNWISTRTLVIDEISLVSTDLWTALSYIAVRMRGVAGQGKPWGGIQLVVCGDFHQLPPVVVAGNEARPRWAFQAPEWQECFSAPWGSSVLLRQIYRQTDQQFLNILAEMRVGNVRPETLDLLNARCCRPLSVQDGILATKLFPLNRDVDEINKMRLAELPGQERVFEAADRLDVLNDDGSDAAIAAQTMGSSHPLFNSIRMQQSVALKVGAQVMLLWNVNEQLGLVNGARGILVGFKQWAPPKTPQQQQQQQLSMIPQWASGNREIPLVKFSCQPRQLIEVEPRETTASNQYAHATRVQIPLGLAWAATVHRAMGLTLDRASIDLSSAFGDGMVYVALSRVKNMDSLSLVAPVQAKSISASDEVAQFYRNFDDPEPREGL